MQKKTKAGKASAARKGKFGPAPRQWKKSRAVKKRRRPPAPKKDENLSLPGYRYLDHTGDIMIEAWGPDYLSALNQAAQAMFAVFGPAKPVEYFEVDEQALGKEELVVYLLSRILAEADAREFVPCEVEVVAFTPGAAPRIKAKIWGEHKRPRDAIKAVTFHELKVEEKLTGCRIQVLLDV